MVILVPPDVPVGASKALSKLSRVIWEFAQPDHVFSMLAVVVDPQCFIGQVHTAVVPALSIIPSHVLHTDCLANRVHDELGYLRCLELLADNLSHSTFFEAPQPIIFHVRCHLFEPAVNFLELLVLEPGGCRREQCQECLQFLVHLLVVFYLPPFFDDAFHGFKELGGIQIWNLCWQLPPERCHRIYEAHNIFCLVSSIVCEGHCQQ
mmetsp:Transcript_46494/g.92366  ORF Transcript_46494/g.92366 Transcript_46494/m.92366 type:complete len:207 (+) Transcript_46494:57-677(+)